MLTMLQGANLQLRGWQQAAVALRMSVGALWGSQRASMIPSPDKKSGKPPFESSLRMETSPDGRAMLLELPCHHSAPVGRAWGQLENNTIGAAYAKLMGSRIFSPDNRPLVQFSYTEEQANAAIAARKLQAFQNTLFGLPTTFIGESFVKFFEFGKMLLPRLLMSVASGTNIFPKQHRGRIKGISLRGNNINFGKYALLALEPSWITSRQIESGRRAILRNARGAKIWVRLIADKPITARPAETRMGKGKGNTVAWVAVVKPGRILYEISGVKEKVAREALEVAASKMPIRAKFIMRADF